MKVLNITPTLLAFGFGNLAMLGWLAAAAAPLLIHLWSRRKYREVPWAAVSFLLAAMRRSARRIQIQQWLLLAIRTAIILLVVFAVAEPYGTGALTVGPSGGPIHKVFVLDGSYSMAARDGEATRFSRSKRLAAELVRASGSADSFTVIEMAQPARVIVDRSVVDHAAVVAEIDSITQSHTRAILTDALALVDEAIESSEGGGGRGERNEVVFFTDLQRLTWKEELNERLNALASRAGVGIVDLAAGSDANLAVTQLSTPEPFVTIGGECELAVLLRQFGDQPRKDVLVELQVDDVPVAEQTVDVPARGEAAVRFSHRFRTAGRHTVAVRAEGDALDVDDRRWLVVPVRDEVRVLCVAGKSGAARFVADALDPDPNDPSPIRPIVVSEGDVAELELGQFDAIFLCNVAQLTAGEAQRLARYAAVGGGIVVFLGDRVQPEPYNVLAFGDPPLLPARIGPLIVEPRFGIDPLDYRHPIVAPFQGRERAGLLTTPVARHFRLEVSPNGPEVAAALAGGNPFIATGGVGRGRVVLVATDGSLSSVDSTTGEPWTAWPAWPSFLPMVREMLAYSAGGKRDQWQQPVGTPLAGRRERAAVAAPNVINVVRPDGRTDAVRVRDIASGDWSYSDTNVSGIYVARDSSVAPPIPFAVNVDTVESDLAKADVQQLPPEIVVHDVPPSASSGTTRELTTRSGWQGELLWAALGLLLLESLLAWRFGRGIA